MVGRGPSPGLGVVPVQGWAWSQSSFGMELSLGAGFGVCVGKSCSFRMVGWRWCVERSAGRRFVALSIFGVYCLVRGSPWE